MTCRCLCRTIWYIGLGMKTLVNFDLRRVRNSAQGKEAKFRNVHTLINVVVFYFMFVYFFYQMRDINKIFSTKNKFCDVTISYNMIHNITGLCVATVKAITHQVRPTEYSRRWPFWGVLCRNLSLLKLLICIELFIICIIQQD